MELWQMIISICAGLITITTVFEKFGITRKVKKVDSDFSELKKLPLLVSSIQTNLLEFGLLQRDQNNALLALLRNSLYQSFKDNRNIGVWTDDEASVQTKLHQAYRALNGNGEEELWWEQKKKWKIVTNEEYNSILKRNNCE